VWLYFNVKHFLYVLFYIGPIIFVLIGGADHLTPVRLQVCLWLSIITQCAFFLLEILALIGG
jgi:hypothetical protein